MPDYLKSLRVLDLTDHRGLLAGHCLAHMGADVIQIEPPSGSPAREEAPRGPGGRSFFWEAYAAGKRGITCNLYEPRGRDLLLQLAKSADFLIESAPAGVMQQIGCGYDELRKVNPKLIYVSLKPFGETGPKAGYADTELVMWAAGGALYGARDGDRPPVRMTVPQAYLHASSDAAVGALIAHFARLQSGTGQHVEISVQTSVAQATLSTILAEAVGDHAFTLEPQSSDGKEPEKLDLSGSGSATSRRKFWQVKDGLVELHLAMGGATGKFTNNLFAWIKDEGFDCPADILTWDWVKLPQEFQAGRLQPEDMNRARAVVGAFLAQYRRRELVEHSVRRKVLIAARYEIPDLADSPHYQARKVFQKGAGENPTMQINWPARTTAEPPPPLRPAPAIGQHNGEIYGALGMDAAALKQLEIEGVV
jgi:crotonobetainyl-CoA:carnitine CoA-transferase CaiB-like acyl-CoA transferase